MSYGLFGSLVASVKDRSHHVCEMKMTILLEPSSCLTNDPNNPYAKAAPDWQRDYPDEQRKKYEWSSEMVTYQRPKNLKWRVICAGVQRLLEQEGLKEEEVSLWVDWQSIYQDDEAEKLKGVKSLIRYATLCQYMLVPTEEAKLVNRADWLPERIPAYGSRGWW